MTPVELTVAAEMARNDLYFYARFMFKERRRLIWQRARHHRRVTDALMRVYRGECKRLILNLPPRYSKTQLAVEAFISWCFGKAPDSEFIHTSYSAPLAVGNSWQVRETMKHPTYRTVFPNTALSTDSASKDHWRTTAGGVMYATGAEGSITGYGAGKMRQGFGGCFPVGTRVWTDRGLVAIDRIVREKLEIRVWSFDYLGKMVLRPVQGWHENPPNEIVRVSFNDGAHVECTPDHRFWTTNRGWVRADSLCEKDRLPRVDRGIQSLDHVRIDADAESSGFDSSAVFAPGSIRSIRQCKSSLLQSQDGSEVGVNASIVADVNAARNGTPGVASPDLVDYRRSDAMTSSDGFGGLSEGLVDRQGLFVGQNGDGMRLSLAESAVGLAIQNVGTASVVAEIGEPIVQGNAITVAGVEIRGTRTDERFHDQVVDVAQLDIAAQGKSYAPIPVPVQGNLENSTVQDVRGTVSMNGSGLAFDTASVADQVCPVISGYRSPRLVEFVRHDEVTFCLTVEEYHNFTIESGLVVKNCIIIDDPHKADEALSDTKRKAVLSNFTTTIESRKNDPMNTPIIVIMQRLHEEDLAGWLEAGGNGEKWEVVRIPVLDDDDEPIWPEKHSREVLHAMEAANPYVFAGQYRQIPAPPAGGNFQPGKIQIVDAVPAGVTSIVRGWDLAASKNSGAFTAGVKLGRIASTGQTIILDVQREQGGPHDVRRLIKGTASQDELGTLQSLPQDPGQAGKVQVGDLGTLLNGFVCKFSPESGDKVARADPFASQVNIGNVLMVKAPWNKTLTDEMTMFPNGKFKDQVDACSRAFAEMDNSMERFMALAGRG